MNQLCKTTLLILGVIATSACSSDPPPAPQAQQKAPPKPAPTHQAAADVEPEEEYRYDPTGKPDPFRSFIKREIQLGPALTAPLERFDLSQLKVTAIIWGTERPRALVRDPAGKGYVIQAGAAIGKNKWRVIEILDNMVLVKETYVDFRDRATTKEVEMRLYENQGG